MSKKTYEKVRITQISDGVFAIAMTLLVVDLKIPADDALSSSQAFRQALLDHLPHVMSWMLSFVMLARFWFLHHSLVGREENRPGSFVALNFVFLAAVALTPFSAALRVHHDEQFWSVVVYSLTFLAAALALWAMSMVDYRERGVLTVRYLIGRSTATWAVVIAIAACVVALYSPRIGAALWLLFPFAGVLARYRWAKADASFGDDGPV